MSDTSVPMTDDEMAEQGEHALRDALLRLDPRYAQSYLNEAYFKHTLDMLLSMIPAMVDGLWQASAENEEKMRIILDRLTKTRQPNIAEVMEALMKQPGQEQEPPTTEPGIYVPPGAQQGGPPVFNPSLGRWVGGGR